MSEGNISDRSREELEEKINELEHTYGVYFGSNKDIKELHKIRLKILELKQELNEKSDN